ncbi:PAS domain-containing sensor histidine kinase [Bradyrhizobium sp. DOA1]|uniref:PAS domain-containing sensor histidine kinase n=1 Tax=Bradyrhizobium sp. DOA1 TaxID=1126616 RepID=UPI00077C1104|nr:PAS domain-containing sensor histidine kinase [Bradyrhizobium sp. DOA1]
MVENGPFGYVSLLPTGHVEYVNNTLLEWSGRTAGEMTGRPLLEFLTVPGRIYYETHLAPLLRMQGSFSEVALDLLKGNGEPLHTIANAKERRDTQGTPTAVRIAFVKATDRRRYEQELLRSREMARAASEATEEKLQREHQMAELREQFIAVLGHDLRNPLAALSAGARILDRTAQSEKERKIITMMQTTITRMAALIDDVLDLARGRLGGGIAVEHKAGKPLEAVLIHVVDELRLASPGREILIDLHVDRPVDCDSSRIGQMLSNLLGNALTHGSASKPVIVRAETRDGTFELSVSNAGEPIPPEAMDKLFEPFFRGKARASRQGLGLGLYIASQIARAHSGELVATSNPEETRFTFTMPVEANGILLGRTKHKTPPEPT